MRIESIALERGTFGARASARIVWEDCGRAPLVLRFESDAHGPEDMEAAPEAFFSACALPAMRAGERRIAIEGTICPRFAAGTRRSIELLGEFYGPPRRPIAIEPSGGFQEAPRRVPERTAMFFTGGADSTHMLQTHRREHPAGSPGAIEVALSTFGHLCPTTEATVDWNARVVPVLADAARAQGLTFTAVRSNVWELAPDVTFIADESLSSALAASAHLFRRRFTRILKASSREAPRQIRSRLQAQQDPLCSTSAVEVFHSPSPVTRFGRLAALAAGPPGLGGLVVCLSFPGQGRLNCGECEKCVRTMIALIAFGALDDARLFPPGGVTAEAIWRVQIGPHDVGYWVELLPALETKRPDLAAVVRERLEEPRAAAAWHAHKGWKGRLRRWDRRLFDGRLVEISRRIRRGEDGA
jgi:hypothetical protein